MAKRRLNKKVALIGSAVLVVIGVLVVLAILHFSQDPRKFIEDGDAAMKAAARAPDDEARQVEYKQAELSYAKARQFAKTDSERREILFRLAGLYRQTDEWRKVLGCWTEISRIDPDDIRARFSRLMYFFTMADSGVNALWQDISTQASETLEVAGRTNLLTADVAEVSDLGEDRIPPVAGRLGPYLYLVKGRALLELARTGAVPNREQVLAEAVTYLEKVRELEPANTQVHLYLAEAKVAQGDIFASRGALERREEAEKEALEILEQAVELADTDPTARINLLSMKLELALRRGGVSPEQIASLEPEYLSVAEKFPAGAEAHSALSYFYGFSIENTDKAIRSAEKALQLDEGNVRYALTLVRLYYRKFSVDGERSAMSKAIDIAEEALTWPDAQDKPGPRQYANRMNRVSLLVFLVDCYLDQVIEPKAELTENQKQQWLTRAEAAVRDMEQLVGTGEAPQVVEWRGMLGLAKGSKQSAIRKMYSAYEQFKSAGRRDPILSYRLAKAFENTAELGAAQEFFESALDIPARRGRVIDNRKPGSLLDYAAVLLKRRQYSSALGVVDFFEKKFGMNERSEQTRFGAYIGAGQLEDAEERLAKRDSDDPNTIRMKIALARVRVGLIQKALARKRMQESFTEVFRGLGEQEEQVTQAEDSVDVMRAELRGHWDDLTVLVERLQAADPNLVESSSVIAVANGYVSQGNVAKAQELSDRFLEVFPDNVSVRFYRRLLAEPNPTTVSERRRLEIEAEVISGITNPTTRGLELGRFYYRNGDLEKAGAEFTKISADLLSGGSGTTEPTAGQAAVTDPRRLAIGYLFEIALASSDWEMGGRIAETARTENLDDCEGRFFAARLAAAKEDYETALTNVNECLEQRPVFSHGFLLRSNIHTALGNEHAALADAQRAAALNPTDGNIAKALASVLYRRNRRFGNNVTPDQVEETRRAVLQAISLNPRDLQLQSFYAEYISDENPEQALAIRQRLHSAYPSVENALLLGHMAMRMAHDEQDTDRKEALFDMAGSAYEQAVASEPQNKAAIAAQAEYYRVRGQAEKARQMLENAGDQRLLWSHYYREGRYEDAKEILDGLYRSGPNDTDIIKGLIALAEKTEDKEAVQKYSEELLVLDDNLDHRLLQVQSMLRLGLVSEAERKLESFKEKYPGEPRSLLLESWLAMQKGRLPMALELTNQSLAADQDSALAWRIRGEINFLMANYTQAVEDLRKSKSYSADPVTRMALAKAYLRQGRRQDAIREIKSAIEDPQAPATARYLVERLYLQDGKKPVLQAFYEQTLAELPDSVFWRNRAGAFALRQGDFARAEDLFRQAWRQNMEYSKESAAAFDGYLQAVVSGAGSPDARADGWKPAKLDRVFEEGTKHVADEFAPSAYYWMGVAKLRLGDKTAATEYCQAALEKAFGSAGDDVSFRILRRVHTLLGAAEISRYWTGVLARTPDSVVANSIMANLMRLTGEYNKALGYLDKCLEILGVDSDEATTHRLTRSLVLQLVYLKTSDNGYLQKLIAEYESLLDKMPNNTVVLNNLAYTLAENTERLTEALEHARRAHELRPGNPAYLDTYAYVLHKNGRDAEAAEFLQAALQQYELNKMRVPGEVYEHLGIVKEQLGAEAEALAAYEQALEVAGAGLTDAAKQRIEQAIRRLQGGAN